MEKQVPFFEEDTIDIKELIGQVLSFKWWILGFTACCLLVAAVFCKTRTPIYEANLLLKTNNQGSQSVLSGLLGGTGTVLNFWRQSNNEAIILQSRSVLAPVIRKLNLDVNVRTHYFPIIGHYIARKYNTQNYQHKPADAWFGFNSYNWGGNTLKIATFNMSDQIKGTPLTLTALGGSHYSLSYKGKVILNNAVTDNTYTLKPSSYTTLTINIAALTAQKGVTFTVSQEPMLVAINSLIGRLVLPKAKRNAGSLMTLKLTGTDPNKTRIVLNAVANGAVAFDIRSQVEEAAKTLSFLQERLPMAQAELKKSEHQLSQYESKNGNATLSSSAQNILSELTNLQGNLMTLELKKAQLLTQYTPQSFQVKQANSSLEAIKKQMNLLEGKLGGLPEKDQILLDLTRNVKMKTAVVTNLLTKIQQFEILKAGTLGKISIVDEAAVPGHPTNAPASRIMMLALVLGLVLGTGASFLWQFFFHGIEDPELIERKTGLAIYGTIQESKNQIEQTNQQEKDESMILRLLSEIDPHDVVVESLRSMRTNLLINLPNAKNNIIAISGPTPKVGKSFISANFAQVLADASHKVLLIDADIRRGDIHSYFKANRTSGFCDLITGEKTTEDVIIHSRIKNLDFISTGTIPSHHSEFLMQPAVGKVLDNLSQQYDYVIIDTAPILAVTDAIQVFRHAGTHLLVFSYGKHDMKEVEQATSLFEKGGIKLDGFIFNRIKLSRSYYGKKYRYNYRYDYN